jgi:hypothetical protein
MYIFWLFNTIKRICVVLGGVSRQLDAENWTRENWSPQPGRATIGRVRQLDGGRMRHALKLFHNI